MRYYELTLTNAKTGKVLNQWSSYPNGTYDPGANNIIFDLPVSPGDVPTGQGGITIENVSLADVTNAQQYAATIQNGKQVSGANITLKGGMGASFPLNNPQQQGVLMNGSVYQSWGNWIGTEMSINFIPVPAIYQNVNPGNIVWQWFPGQSITDALKATLSVAYPSIPFQSNVSANVATTRLDVAFFSTFAQLAAHIKQLTAGVVSSTYQGVGLVFQSGTITAYDGTDENVTINLAFNDFVGQPTWVEPNTIQVQTVLRGDIQVGNFVKFPVGYQGLPGFVQTQQASSPSFFKYQSAIQGKFLVNQIRHIGNLREPNLNAWSTLLNCVVVQ